jgi:hypothetical protein
VLPESITKISSANFLTALMIGEILSASFWVMMNTDIGNLVMVKNVEFKL